jgi:hypothetical protein
MVPHDIAVISVGLQSLSTPRSRRQVPQTPEIEDFLLREGGPIH